VPAPGFSPEAFLYVRAVFGARGLGILATRPSSVNPRGSLKRVSVETHLGYREI